MLKYLLYFIIFATLITQFSFSQNLTEDTVSTNNESIKTDTLRLRVINNMGQLQNYIDTLSNLNNNNFLLSDKKNVTELVKYTSGFFFRGLGEEGKLGEICFNGLSGRYTAIMIDGTPLNDPTNNLYNLADIQLDFIDHVEIINGSNAAITSNNSGGTTINFVTKSYNNYLPITKIRFVQDPYGTILTDGMFAQNIATALNLSIGFQRNTSEGKFPNAELDSWNTRIKLRYNFSDKLNLSLTDLYTHSHNQYNGGLNLETSTSFDEFGGAVNNYNAWNKKFRHDLSLGVLAKIFNDTISTTSSNVYYSSVDNEYNDTGNSIKDKSEIFIYGVNFRQTFNMHPIIATIGFSFEKTTGDSTNIFKKIIFEENNVYTSFKLGLIEQFQPYASISTANVNRNKSANKGLGFSSALLNNFSIYLDMSWHDKFPNIHELFYKNIITPDVLLKEKHSSINGGINWSPANTFRINIDLYKRTIENAVVYKFTNNLLALYKIENSNKILIQGLNANAILSFHKFKYNGTLNLNKYKDNDTTKTLIPNLIIKNELTYKNTFFNDNLDAIIGVRHIFYNSQNGMMFSPQSQTFFENNIYKIGRTNIVDVFAVLTIGDADISLSLNNVLGKTYYLTPVYPMPGRFFRIGVNWNFLN